ncbi:MAG: glycosyltransferase [Xanthobacteraceae bacterium]
MKFKLGAADPMLQTAMQETAGIQGIGALHGDVGIWARFDSVVMLTRSNWHTEPRSNRYHYATSFARHLPVLFVQPDLPEQGCQSEKTEIDNINILHVGQVFDREGASFLDRSIKKMGFKRPLLWIYNEDFLDYVSRVQHLFKIYHATEDCFVQNTEIRIIADHQVARVRNLLKIVDLVIAVSPNVADNYVKIGGYKGRVAVIPNGCDFEFWYSSGAYKYVPQGSNRPVAFYQGGINGRLDYQLIRTVMERLPDWDFWFCGRAEARSYDFETLLEYPNFVYHGELTVDKVAELAKRSSVGLIPMLDDPLIRASWPLKAFEYIACGLGVVSTEIDAMRSFPEAVKISRTPEEFTEAIRNFAPARTLESVIRRRLDLAREHSYSNRFQQLQDEITQVLQAREIAKRAFNMLILCDEKWNHVMTIKEHLSAFKRFSKNQCFFVPGTVNNEIQESNTFPDAWDLETFDVVVVHYAVRLSLEDYINPGIAKKLAEYGGLKVLFIQDEYDTTETARRWMEKIGFDAVFTCVPEESREDVYPRARFPGTEFVRTLTGYVPEDESIERFVLPMAKRHLRIAYRGRELPPLYGALGREKYLIGVDVRRLAEERGIPVDIDVTNNARIYGADWYKFIGSARATLGTESGSNIFDFSGELAELSRKLADRPYDEVYEKYFASHEGPVKMNQVSPKIFEAIRMRTALVLFEGEYSGVVKPGLHFILLKKDYSNIDDVFEKLEDVEYLKRLTTRAYDDVIEPGRYSYRQFIAEFDAYIDMRAPGLPRAEIISAPILRKMRGGQFEAIPHRSGWEFTLNSEILGGDFQSPRLKALIDVVFPARVERPADEETTAYETELVRNERESIVPDPAPTIIARVSRWLGRRLRG